VGLVEPKGRECPAPSVLIQQPCCLLSQRRVLPARERFCSSSFSAVCRPAVVLSLPDLCVRRSLVFRPRANQHSSVLALGGLLAEPESSTERACIELCLFLAVRGLLGSCACVRSAAVWRAAPPLLCVDFPCLFLSDLILFDQNTGSCIRVILKH